jgi:hypothetical protein
VGVAAHDVTTLLFRPPRTAHRPQVRHLANVFFEEPDAWKSACPDLWGPGEPKSPGYPTPSDMQFINNYHVLLARTAYPEPGRKRFLKRLWLETRKLTERPRHLQLAGSNKSWWARNRTKAS